MGVEISQGWDLSYEYVDCWVCSKSSSHKANLSAMRQDTINPVVLEATPEGKLAVSDVEASGLGLSEQQSVVQGDIKPIDLRFRGRPHLCQPQKPVNAS